MKKQPRPKPAQSNRDLQSFLDYSVLHYEDLGRVLSSALKKPAPRKSKG